MPGARPWGTLEDMGDGDGGHTDVIVIGAGFSGLYALHRLRSRGFSVQVLEQADGVGGTWYWNRYPGARCDSESYYYCYSFDPELEQEWRWTERYPGQEEIRGYLEHVADRYDLRRDIAFGVRVSEAAWDGAGWTVTSEDGTSRRCRWLVTAVGCLSAANVPDIPGLADFAGEWHHTGRWPHEGVDVSGRRVGVVGTGSTGIQAIPVLAEAAGHLTVFQRTANYSIPARNAPLSEEEMTATKSDYAAIRRVQQGSTNGHPFVLSDVDILDLPADQRRALYDAAWERGGLRFRAAVKDVLSDPDVNADTSEFLREKIRETVHDPATAETLTPRDHPFATKRPPIDTHYFETYNRENVSLVDVKADPIAAITPDGVRLESGAEHPLDVLVFATGFDALTGPLLSFDIRGRDGVSLREAWREGPRTHLGLGVAGFPDLFTVTGPGSPSVLTNMPTAIEQHVDWIADLLERLRATGEHAEPTPEAEATWASEVARAADATLLPQAASSWYLGANVPGKARVFLPYAGGYARYRATCDDEAAAGYPGFGLAENRTNLANRHAV
ncbi:NAD(P)/FAD-dependent oxidoreductase [Actinomycetospora corticicola]|uniref:Cation diffusion facilitator CzcD-associated flavoprotein CzcO n=1 Tax=Actinomycetospora corticicola TaxID=663602 RepID=A0A7Y9DSX8_9PSEU|nr:NAD(P)/FAD-dependent oxidoreductase [Actinomycetospora corticicola]NYD34903.1 cation diffusion facilitator CzcD-associated flavoprotein CzcO [Actinomycetospora corticicola]